MHSKILSMATLFMIASASVAAAQDARTILETAKRKQIERWAGVETYLVEQSIMGSSTRTLFQRTELEENQTAFLPVSSGLTGKCKMAGRLPKGMFGAGGGQIAANYDSQALEKFTESARLVGTESVEGRSAYHLRVDDLREIQKADGNEYRLDTLDLWIDAQEYVPLRMKMDGTMVSGKETRPITIENLQEDYRAVPGSKMYEAFKQTMQISGMMDAVQEAQMREAQAKMVELEQQLAGMPAGQRQMMEKMMGPQLEMVKNMSAGGGFRTEIVTQSISVNPAKTDADDEPCPTIGALSTLPPRASAAAPTVAVAPVGRDPATLQSAQQACLQRKMDEANQKKKRKRGFRGLLKVVGRSAARFGNADLGRATKDIYDIDATSGELSQVAEDLGLTDDDVAACRNPQ